MSSLVILTDILPSHTSEPGSPRLFALAREWAREFDLILVCIGKGKRDDDSRMHEEVSALFKDIVFLPEPPVTSFLGKIRHRVNNAPFFLQRYRSPKYCESIQSEVEKVIKFYSAIHLHVNQVSNSQYIPDSLNPLKVTIDVRDDPTLLYEREARLSKSWWRIMSLMNEAYSQGKYLKNISAKGYKIIVVGFHDRDNLLQKWNIKTYLVPNGVDQEYYHHSESSDKSLKPKKSSKAVFTGVMSYKPNVEAAIYFANQIFPSIKKQCPDLEFTVVGANPPQEVLELELRDGIKVTGTVPDVRPYLEDASVFVCPMLSGAGIKNKILAAMSTGVPVVSTSLGVAGVEAEKETHFILSDEPLKFAENVVNIVKHEEEYRKMTLNALDLVREKYGWKRAASSISGFFGHQAS
ncbi:MAG TPA: glycosyltransferase family 4 protein [Oligoflexia bacterium]|nr:glycosyltransferase family 4 protein [Oligoflexia bacterium]HMP47039.1 glycosyltransferase family 4 protein [Oligoflexia bacterium]